MMLFGDLRQSSMLAERRGAYMECIERHWGERSLVEPRIARTSDLSRDNEWFVPLAVMPLPLGVPDPGDVPLAWMAGTTLEGRRIWVPAHDVLCPFVPSPGTANPAIVEGQVRNGFA